MQMSALGRFQLWDVNLGFGLVLRNATAVYRNVQPISWMLLPTLLVLSIIYAANFADPFIDHDDYPFLTSPGASDWYYTNYLPQEGRWLLWVWTHYSKIFPASTMFTLNVLLWAASCAIIAFFAPLGTNAMPARVGLAMVLAVSPHFAYEIRWPFATLPIFATLLLISFATNYLERRSFHVLALAALMSVTMIAFQALAFYFLGVALMLFCARLLVEHSTDQPTTDDITGAVRLAIVGVAFWLAACVFAVLLQYTLQYVAFGKFGLEIGEWRIKDEYRNASGLYDQLAYALSQPFRIARVYYNDAFLAFAGAVLAAIVLAARIIMDIASRQHNRAVLWGLILAGQTALFFMIAGVTLLTGAYVPIRAGFVCWIAFVSPVWMLMIVASRPWEKGLAVTAAGLVLIGAASSNGYFIEKMRSARADDVQYLTSVKQRIEAKFGNYTQKVLLVGVPPHLSGHPHLFFDDVGLAGLMNHKIKIKNFVSCANINKSLFCQQTVQRAGAVTALNNAPIFPSELAIFQSGDRIFVKLGPVKLGASP